jgi:hypothetical protein
MGLVVRPDSLTILLASLLPVFLLKRMAAEFFANSLRS